MGNTPKRPSTARKHTRTTETKRKSELDQGLRVTYDGVPYEIHAGDLTALDTLALRRETGFTFGRLLSLDPADFDIDVIAAVLWLCRRQAGEVTLRYADVAKDITYDGVIDSFKVDEADEESPGE